MDISKIGSLVGLITGALFIKDAMDKPPVPRCPNCGMPLHVPGTRYSKCIRPGCGQLIDWRVKP